MAGTTVRIQLGGRNGSQIRGFMLVDQEDADLAGFRWSMKTTGYAVRFSHKGGVQTQILPHRVILERAIGRTLAIGEYTDHINHNRIDNRRSNLRVATIAQNARNRRSVASHNTTGFLGVYRDKRRGTWVAQAVKDGVKHYGGSYKTPEAAGAKAAQMRRQLGFPEPVH